MQAPRRPGGGDTEARRPTLLIVDDELRILTALQRSLRREGYEILTASSPREALEVVAARPVDLVLSDYKMPGMSGVALLAEVSRKRPQAARLLITGWTEEVPAADLAAVGVRRLIAKPWDDAELKRALREALAG